MNFRHKLGTASTIFHNQGWNGIKSRLRLKYFLMRQAIAYRKWVRKSDVITEKTRREMCRQIGEFSRKPLISIVMPVYNVEEIWLRLCIESVIGQIYENWELCIADDCSPSPHIRRILEEYAAQDERVKVIFRSENGHISAASNSALELATGEFSALLDHDDELAEHALFYVVKEINDFPEVAMIYSDEDKIDECGRRSDPIFKPEWSRDLFYSLNLITHLSVYQTSVLREIGGWQTGFEGSQDYDLALRFIEQIPETGIRHVPHILYHWRTISGSVALDGSEKPYAHENARAALREHLKRIGKRAKVSQTIYNLHRVQYDLPAQLPKVSVILLENDAVTITEKSLQILTEKTDYQNFEIALICSSNTKLKVENFSHNAKIIFCDDKSEAEKYNFGVSQTDGEYLCFINGNLRPVSEDWLNEIAGFVSQKEIGAVGAKILSSNGVIFQCGIFLGINDFISSAFKNFPRHFWGSSMRTDVVGNFSAVSIDCLATRREIFQNCGGFDTEKFPNRLFDIDFCLKLREENLRIVFTPYAEFIQTKKRKILSVQKNVSDAESDLFKRKWRRVIENDPFYNPNLSRRSNFFTVDS